MYERKQLFGKTEIDRKWVFFHFSFLIFPGIDFLPGTQKSIVSKINIVSCQKGVNALIYSYRKRPTTFLNKEIFNNMIQDTRLSIGWRIRHVDVCFKTQRKFSRFLQQSNRPVLYHRSSVHFKSIATLSSSSSRTFKRQYDDKN